MALFGRKNKKLNYIHEHASEASARGISGSFTADLDDYYDGDVGKLNADIITSIIEIVPKIARMKIVLKKGEEEYKNKLTYLLNEKPNKWETAYHFKVNVIKESILRGNSYVEVVRDSKGEIEELRRLDITKVHIGKSYEDEENKSYISDVVYSVGDTPDDENSRIIEREDMLHFKPFNFENEGLEGISVTDYLVAEIERVEGINKLFKNYVQAGGLVGGQIKVNTKGKKLTSSDKEEIKSAWKENIKGYNPVYVTDEYIEFNPNQQSGDVLNTIINEKSTASKFAQVFGLPLHKMGISTSNMSLTQLNQEFLNNTLALYILMFETEINDKFFRVRGDYESTWEFDTQPKIHTMDFESRKAVVEIGMKNGLMRGNQGRVILGLEEEQDDSLEKYRVSLNSVNSEIADEYQKNRRGTNQSGGEIDE